MVANEQAKLALIAAAEKITGIEIHMFSEASWFGFKADVVAVTDAAYEEFDVGIRALGLTPAIERSYELGESKRGLRIVIDVPMGWQPPTR